MAVFIRALTSVDLTLAPAFFFHMMSNASNATSLPDDVAIAQATIDALIERVTEQITLDTFDPEDHQTIQQLVEGFADARGMVRLRLAETLAEIGDPTTPFLLAALAHHANPVVRRAAAKTITLIADPVAIPTLVHSLLHDEDTVVQGSSVGALARMGEAAVPVLLEILAAPEHPESTKGHAAWALAFIGSEAKHLLYREIHSPTAEIRYAVVGAIAKVAQETPSETQAFEVLMNALTDPAEMVRDEAASALGNLGYRPAIPNLVTLLQHPAWETRKAAVLALMKIGGDGSAESLRSVIDPLQTALQQEAEPNVQTVIKLALTQIARQATSSDWS
jgi:bilin biosynthesis protein